MELSCKQREIIFDSVEGWRVHSGLTDMSGRFGEPKIETIYGLGVFRIQDCQYLEIDGAIGMCEHFFWLEFDDKS